MWEAVKHYCQPKLRSKIREIVLDRNQTDAHDKEDGYMVAAIMWKRTVENQETFKVSESKELMQFSANLMRINVKGSNQGV